MLDHFYTFEGNLYDHRKHHSKIIRKNFCRAHRIIKTVADLKATLRQKYTWPGGYEIVFICDDGEILCHKCVVKNLRWVIYSMRHGIKDGWGIIGSDYLGNFEDKDTFCCYCNKPFHEED